MCVLVIITLNGCDKTPYHHGKGKFTLLNNLMSGTYPGLANVLDEGSIKHAKMLEAAKPICIALFSFCSSLSSSHQKQPFHIPRSWIMVG